MTTPTLLDRVRAMQLRGNTPPDEMLNLRDDLIAYIEATAQRPTINLPQVENELIPQTTITVPVEDLRELVKLLHGDFIDVTTANIRQKFVRNKVVKLIAAAPKPDELARLRRFRSAVIGWRERDWPEWFDRASAEATADLGREAEEQGHPEWVRVKEESDA